MENQDIFDQFTENRQIYMTDNSLQHVNNAIAGFENANVVAGVEVENVSVGGEILGVKYDEQQLQHHDEHDVGDDDESKYVNEEQQSEKQQQQQQQPLKSYALGDGDYDSYEFVGRETAKGSNDFGNGNDMGGFVFGGEHLQHQDMFNLGNGHNGHEIHENEEIAISKDFPVNDAVEYENRNPFDIEMEGIKAESDFSFTSHNTESAEDFVPQVDVKIESKPEQQEHQELGDEEEPSSVATNTTNGTSSLSENIPQPALAPAPASAFDDLMATLDNKENDDPLTPQRPDALNIDQAHSLLNPDAKEFVPSFGSNPSSPTSPFATGMQSSDLGEPLETQMYFGQQPSALPRHLLGDDDDLVAQSPRKGRGDNNMDSVPLPKELSEFEEEADKRPHELEPKDVDVLQNSDGAMTPDQQVQQLPLDDIPNEQENQEVSLPQDITDFQPSSIIMDHGPETSVDLDVDLDLQVDNVRAALHEEEDVMKRSIYVASDEAAIEDVLNSVQPIPTEIDSVNNSFIEESATESAAAHLPNDKELLQVEEKEHVSHSPSTEEIQMNLQNTLNSSNKDIHQLPMDMDQAYDMQESMHEPQEQLEEKQEELIDAMKTTEVAEESFLADTTNPLIATDDNFLNNSFEPQQQESDLTERQQQESDFAEPQQQESDLMTTDDSFLNKSFEQQQEEKIQEPFEQLNSLATDSTAIAFDALNIDLADNSQQQQQEVINEALTPSSTTEEKHLFEETKEDHTEQQKFFSQEHEEHHLLSEEPKDQELLSDENKEQNLFSISGLEQQMNEMMLNNDSHLSQVEEVAAPPANTTAIDDEFEHLITPEVAAVNEKEHSQEEKMLIDESFNAFEQEPIREQEQQHEQQETHEEPVQEFIESPMQNQDLENEMVAVEEPLIEAKHTTPLYNTEETEIANEPPKQMIELCMVPETAPCVLLEQPEDHIIDTETEIVKSVRDEDHKPMELIEEPKREEVIAENISAAEEVKEDISLAATATAAIAATAALAATAAAVTAVESKVASSPTKKSEVAKKPLAKTTTTSTTAKPKVGATTTAAKKPLETVKKPIGLAAKPRVAPAKPASATTEKKPLTKPTTTARKPLAAGSVSAAPKPTAAKTTTTSTTTRTTARPTTAPRTTTTSSTTTTTRKPLASTTTSGPAAAKPRPATAPAKPTSLGLPATNGAAKTKVTSPRPTLSSQLRKPAAPTPKSPTKPTNVVTKTSATSTLASRTKTTTASSVSTTHGTTGTTKTFTARPAPKFTTSSSSTTTTTTTRRSTVGGITAATTTTTTSTKTSGAPLRKSSPSKPLGGRTPTRPSAGGMKSKTPLTKKESPPEQKPAPIRKPVDKTIIPNGEPAVNLTKELNGDAEHPLNGGDGGDMQQAVQHNGDSIIPNQHHFLEPRDEQIPMDVINA